MVQTIILLPDDLKTDLDRRAPTSQQRDELVTAALRAYLTRSYVNDDSADLAIINAHAADLNIEAEDALAYQVPM